MIKLASKKSIYGLIIMVLFFVGLFVLSTPGIWDRDPEKIVEEIYRYRESHGFWPETLGQLKSSLPDIDLSSKLRSYVYLQKNGMFILEFHTTLESGRYYRSDTGEWLGMHYHPQDQNWKSYNKLIREFRNR